MGISSISPSISRNNPYMYKQTPKDVVNEGALIPNLEAEKLQGKQMKMEGKEASSNEMFGSQKEECQTCKNRKYQDGSNDPSVSFQTPTHISPSNSASAVMGHEMEHVTHERARAARDDKEILSQSVIIKTAICPECGKVYVSGGETTTTMRSKAQDAYETVGKEKPSTFQAQA